ncbi:transmembrane protein 82 isoform X3 [Tympanuchus pallidicinctus]|uniref:transmembrane protein 82 isoform X3 n=1 Tax=Tympanuchus pallidicinctus TaxID=109042 RepID=UPI0022873E12|nr:transmembrane protein 82 isoform X3 [Tympanuchus pallidicinctus]
MGVTRPPDACMIALVLCNTHAEDKRCSMEESAHGGTAVHGLAVVCGFAWAPTASSCSCCASSRWAAGCPAASASCWRKLPMGPATWCWRRGWRGCWPCTPAAWLYTPARCMSCTAKRGTAASACCCSPLGTACPGCCARLWLSPSSWLTWPPSRSSIVISSRRRRPSASGRRSLSATRCSSFTCKRSSGQARARRQPTRQCWCAWEASSSSSSPWAAGQTYSTSSSRCWESSGACSTPASCWKLAGSGISPRSIDRCQDRPEV